MVKKKRDRIRIEEMIEVIMKVGQGDLSVQLDLSGKDDLLDSLAMGLNMMIDDLGSTHAVEVQNEKFKQINTELEKAIDRAQESERLKTAFLANMSHEIRTPLNSILGFSELLSPDLEEGQFEDYSEIIRNSGIQLLQIIDDILDFSKLESNQLPLFFSLCNINKIMQEVYITQKQSKKLRQSDTIQLKEPQIELSNDIYLKTDPVRLKQILNNLINNAIKFTKEGFVEFGFSIKAGSRGEMIEFYVKDTGIGISDTKQKAIFERFIQVDSFSMKEGNGLGLSICKGLVELLGGVIWVESIVDEGSCFYFTLPFSDQGEMGVTKQVEQHNGKWSLSGSKVFIAEDNLDSLTYLEEVLLIEGVIVKTALDGQSLLELLKEDTPDLILLDINMPVKNGYETIAEIRKSGLTMPVIAQTAYAMPEERSTILAAGCTDYISKPIQRTKLLSLIREVLKKDSK
ncbi:ATP-binding protein [Sunxiuqinia indica]|uniref:ATP-binding protein n=1 Tax=Sunxiuqinia indica TaxID=2692584 RepID=UPI00135B1921|nr:ATP-binding protein [Sunxiuqinia indica]